MSTYLVICIRRSRAVTAIGTVALVAVGVIFTAFFASLRPDRNFAHLLDLLPKSFRAFLGGQYVDIFSAHGFLAVGYKHPLTLLVIAGTGIAIASRTPAGDIGTRAMDLVLSHPVARRTVVLASLVMLWGTAALAVAGLFLGHTIGIAVFGLDVDDYATRFAPVWVHGWLFAGCIGTIALAVSTRCANRGRAVGWAAGLVGAFLLLDFGAQLGEPLAWLGYATPFGYYEPARIVAERHVAWGDVVALAVASCVAAAAALVGFARREVR